MYTAMTGFMDQSIVGNIHLAVLVTNHKDFGTMILTDAPLLNIILLGTIRLPCDIRTI